MNPITFSVQQAEHPTNDAEREKILAAPEFGKVFTDHMVTIDYDADRGWHDAAVVPFGNFQLSPASSVLHYGQAIFEGLKAYRRPDGSIVSFRPEENAKRMQRSADRIDIPELPVDLFLEAVRQLVDIDQAWVPEADGESSLYIRPAVIATESSLGVHPSNSYRFFVIASPAGPYFTGGMSPVSVWISDDYVRAAPGGTGDAKFAGNYAASLLAQDQAAQKGCDQVVWLDAIERSYIEEMGGMNMMFVYGSESDEQPPTVVTPSLSGSLLPGITRASLLKVAADLGYNVDERCITVQQWRDGVADGSITETLACGTAAVVTPIGTVRSNDGDFTINDNVAGPVTTKLRDALTGIQVGTVPDQHGWLTTFVSAS